MEDERYDYLLERISKLEDKLDSLVDMLTDICFYVEEKQKAEKETMELFEKRQPFTEQLFGK